MGQIKEIYNRMKIIWCIKHGEILFNGACDKCRNDKLDKILEKSFWSKIRRILGS